MRGGENGMWTMWGNIWLCCKAELADDNGQSMKSNWSALQVNATKNSCVDEWQTNCFLSVTFEKITRLELTTT